MQVKSGDENSDLRSEIEALAHVGIVIDCLLVLIVEAKRGDSCAQDFHRCGSLREFFEEFQDFGVNLAGVCEFLFEGFEFGCGGKFAMPEEIGGFLKIRFFLQFKNENTAVVGEHPGLSIDPANARVGCDNPFKTF